MVINQISSDKIIATYLFYNRAKRTDRNIIDKGKITKPTKSPNTHSDFTCTVNTANQEQKDSKYNYIYDSTCNYC